MGSPAKSAIVVVALGLPPLGSASCLPSHPPAAAAQAFSDDFSKAALSDHFVKRGGSWRVIDGALNTVGDHNLPLWLDVPLTRNVRVTFTAWSNSPAVDTKVEVFGDGVRHESGYSIILAGWNNTLSTIARLGEHEKNRVTLKRAFEKGRKYRWTVQRTDGHTLELLIDGERLLRYDDKSPLWGEGHDRLGFSSWESEVYYDDLTITPLP